VQGPEAYAVHRKWLEQRGDGYDPRVRKRLLAAKDMLAADYLELLQVRSRLVQGFGRERHGVDAFVLPAVPKTAPPIEALERDAERFFAVNPLMLRNTSLFNFLDACALSLPIHAPGTAPVGLMVAGFPGEDERVLSIGVAIEALAAR
jgi:aspartyl-tRNA(Asn)/glutamyl-tRNA(Gln) amidotransferase subunit A